MRSRFRSQVVPLGIFGVVVLAIGAAVWILPSTARGATRHQHVKGEILPLGTIDGRHTPEAIPDAVAYGLLFRTLQSLSQDPENAAAYQSYLEFMRLDASDHDGRESEQVQFRRVVERFTTQIWRLDLEVARIKEVWRTTGRRQRDPFIETQIQDLELRRQAVLSTIVADLPRDLGIQGAEKVRSFMLDRVRRHSKIYPKRLAQ